MTALREGEKLSSPCDKRQGADVTECKTMAKQEFRYQAFISYRHVEPDRTWAKWLHAALETYRVPAALAGPGQLPGRVGRCFRDEEELPASADLNAEIETALTESRFLIVVCSPRTPASEWVNKEVERFREMGRHDRILALLIEGEPGESFPRSLREIRHTLTDAEGRTREEIEEVEPLAADVRPSRGESPRYLKRMARLRMLACLLGARFDDLRQREQERRTRRLAALGVVVSALLAVMTALAGVAFHQRSQAVHARDDARDEAAKSKAVTQFLQNMLASVDPERARGAEVTVRETLDQAARGVEAELSDTPSVEAAIRNTIGSTYRALGLHKAAEEHLLRALDIRRAAGASTRDTLETQAALAHLRRLQGKYGESLRLATDASTNAKDVLEPDDPLALRLRSLQALALTEMGRYSEAENALRELVVSRTRTLGAEHEETLESIGNLGTLLDHLGKPEEAERLARRVLDVRRRTLGTDHPDTLAAQNALCAALWQQKRGQEAESLARNALDTCRRVYGEAHPATSTVLGNLAAIVSSLGRKAEAEHLTREALDLTEQRLGATHPGTITARANLGVQLLEQNRLDEAQIVFRRVLADRRAALGDDCPNLAVDQHNLASVLLKQGRLSEAEKLSRDAVAHCLRVVGQESVRTVEIQAGLGRILVKAGKHEEAEAMLVGVLGARRRLLGEGAPEPLDTLCELGTCLKAQSKYAQAEDVYRRALASAKTRLGDEDVQTNALRVELVELLEKQGKKAEAKELEAVVMTLMPKWLAKMETAPGEKIAGPSVVERREPPARTPAAEHYRHRAVRSQYAATVLQVQVALEREDTQQALQLLESCLAEDRGWEWGRLWRQARGPVLALRGHAETVYSVACGANGQWLASCSDDGTAYVWDAATGRRVHAIPFRTGVWPHVTFSPDGTRLAGVGRQGKVEVWDAAAGKRLMEFESEPVVGKPVVFSPDGRSIVTGGQRAIEVWDAENGKLLRRFDVPERDVWSVCFTPDGQRLVTWTGDRKRAKPIPLLSAWDFETGKVLWETQAPGSEALIALSGDGRRVAVGSGSWDGRRVRLYDAGSGTLEAELKVSDPVEVKSRAVCVAFSPDSRLLAVGHSDGRVRLWTLDGMRLLTSFHGHVDQVQCVAFSPDGRRVVSAGNDRLVRVWDVADLSGPSVQAQTGIRERTLLICPPDGKWVRVQGDEAIAKAKALYPDAKAIEGKTGAPGIEYVAFTPRGQSLVMNTKGKGIWVVDAGTGKKLASWLEDEDAPTSTRRVQLSPDGKLLAAHYWLDRRLTTRIWTVPDGRLVHELKGHTKTLEDLAFSPDGRRLATSAQDGAIRIWDVDSGKQVELIAPISPVKALAFSPDGRRLAGAGNGPLRPAVAAGLAARLREEKPDTRGLIQEASGLSTSTIRIWDTHSGEQTAALPAYIGHVDLLAFTPDGTRLVTAGSDDESTIQVWDSATGERVARFVAHKGPVRCFAFSPGGKRLASGEGGRDAAVRVWDLASGQELMNFRACDDRETAASAMAFSRDGRRLAVAASGGALTIWDAARWTPDQSE